ncbi:MAG: hypothetical protein IJT30_10305 [Muribaculaceae bacterium]|nr:hypothetical protein [Muribaculaceae bacterium]
MSIRVLTIAYPHLYIVWDHFHRLAVGVDVVGQAVDHKGRNRQDSCHAQRRGQQHPQQRGL